MIDENSSVLSTTTDLATDRGRRIRLKCKCNGDVRVVILLPDHSFSHLKRRLSLDYGFEVALKYEDEDGDLIVLSSQNDLDDLVSSHPDRDTINIIVSEAQAPLVLPVLSRRDNAGRSQIFPASAGGPMQQSRMGPRSGTAMQYERFPQIDSPVANPRRENRRNIRWKRGEVLGQGAFGVVNLGLNVETGELMAVKQIAIDELSNKDLSAIENEIALMRSFRHPNIVRYIGTEVTPIALSIFLEYVPGGSLKTLIDKFGALEESVAKSYTRQLLLGLEYLHRNGVAHRDIKGANCLVGNDGVIKLADFGSSKQWRSSGSQSNTTTGNGEMKGTTPSWMAPEIVRGPGNEISWKKADVWSLACTTIEMVTGKPPWSQFNNNSVTILYHIACTEALPDYPNPASEELLSFLNTCLSRDPVGRPDITSLLLHPFVANMGASFWGNHMGGNFAAVTGFAMRPTTVNTSHGNREPGGMWRRTASDAPATRGSLTTAATLSASRVSSSSASSLSGLESKRDRDGQHDPEGEQYEDRAVAGGVSTGTGHRLPIDAAGDGTTTLDSYLETSRRFEVSDAADLVVDDATETIRTGKTPRGMRTFPQKEEGYMHGQLDSAVPRYEDMMPLRVGSMDSDSMPVDDMLLSVPTTAAMENIGPGILSSPKRPSGLFIDNMNFEDSAEGLVGSGSEYAAALGYKRDDDASEEFQERNDGNTMINQAEEDDDQDYEISGSIIAQNVSIVEKRQQPNDVSRTRANTTTSTITSTETEGAVDTRRRIKFQLDDDDDNENDENDQNEGDVEDKNDNGDGRDGAREMNRNELISRSGLGFASFGEDSLESIDTDGLLDLGIVARTDERESRIQQCNSEETIDKSINRLLEGRRRGEIQLEPIVGRPPLPLGDMADMDYIVPKKGKSKGSKDSSKKRQNIAPQALATGTAPAPVTAGTTGVSAVADDSSGMNDSDDQSEYGEWSASASLAASRRASISSVEFPVATSGRGYVSGISKSMSMSGRSSPTSLAPLAPLTISNRSAAGSESFLGYPRVTGVSLDSGLGSGLMLNGGKDSNSNSKSVRSITAAAADPFNPSPASVSQPLAGASTTATLASPSASGKLPLDDGSTHSVGSQTKLLKGSGGGGSGRSDGKLQKLRVDIEPSVALSPPQITVTSSTLYSPKGGGGVSGGAFLFPEGGVNNNLPLGDIDNSVLTLSKPSHPLKTPNTSYKKKEKQLISGNTSSPARKGSDSPGTGWGMPEPHVGLHTSAGQLRVHGTAAAGASRVASSQPSWPYVAAGAAVGSAGVMGMGMGMGSASFDDGRSFTEMFRGLQSRYDTDSVAEDDGSFFAPAARFRQRTAGISTAHSVDSIAHEIPGSPYANLDISNLDDSEDADFFSAPIVLEEHSGPITRLRCPKRSNVLLSSSLDGSIRIWSPNDERSRVVMDCESFNMQIGESDASVATVSSSGRGGGGRGKHSGAIRVTNMWVQSACDAVYAGCSDGVVRVWGGHDGRALRCLKGHEDNITAVEGLNPQSSLQPSCLVATGSVDRTIRVWDIRAKKAQAFMFRGHADSVIALRWSEGGCDEMGRESGSGKVLVSGGKDKTIRIWDMRAGRLRATLEKHLGSVTSQRFLPAATGSGGSGGGGGAARGISFVSGAKDSMLHLWDEMGDCIGAQPGHRGAVTFFSNFNYNFSMAGLGGNKHQRSGKFNNVLSTPYSQSIPMMLSCGADNIVKIWDMKRFRTVSEFSVGTQGGPLTKAVWVGPNALVTANGGAIRLWEHVPEHLASTGHNVNVNTTAAAGVDSSFSADSQSYMWRCRDLASHGHASTDLLSTEHFIASGSKSGQILYWGS